MKVNLSDMERDLEKWLNTPETEKGMQPALKLGCCIDMHKNCKFEYNKKGDKIVEFRCRNPRYDWQCRFVVEFYKVDEGQVK